MILNNAEWTLIGIFIGLPIGFIISSVLSSDKIEDLDTEVQDLRTQRQLLKDEIFRLSKPKRKPQPRKKMVYKPRNTRKKIW